MTVLRALAAPHGGRIGFGTSGSTGNWIVLLHGWCGSAEVWDATVPLLARDHRVLAVSYPGFGGLPPPPPSGRTMRALGAAVARVLDHLDLVGVTLVGHSMGGAVAVEAAVASPRRVGAVLGLDSLSDRSFYGRVPDDEILRRRADFLADYPGRMRAMVDDIVDPATGGGLRGSIADAMVAAAAPSVALDVRDDLLAWDVEARWPLVACPAMLLNSPHVTRVARAHPMTCFGQTRTETYASGHFPMLEAPDMIIGRIRACLLKLAALKGSAEGLRAATP